MRSEDRGAPARGTGHLTSDAPAGDGDVEQTWEISVPAAASELASLRRWARQVLHERAAPGDVVDDIELATSELATNVIRHTGSDTVRVRVTRTWGAWILDVADAERAPTPAGRQLPPSDDPTGRGLYVVSSVMDRVDLVEVEGATVVRCTRLDSS